MHFHQICRVPLQLGYCEQPQNIPWRPERRRIEDLQRGQVGVADVVVTRGGIGLLLQAALVGCGADLSVGVIVSVTFEAGTLTPNSRNASRRVLADLRVPSPWRIVASSLAFSAAKRPRIALSSATS